MPGRKYILKNRIRLNANLDKDLNDKLIEYSNKTNIPRTRILDMALEKFFNGLESEGKI